MKSSESQSAIPYPFDSPDGLDLHPHYAELRAKDELTRVRLPYGDEAWMCTRHSDVRQVLTDARFSRAATLTRDEPRVGVDVVDRGLLSMDPPEHSRLRRVAAAGLTPRRAERLRPRTEEIADGLLDDLARTEPPVDLMASFVYPFAVTVICDLLGVPYEDREDFQTWSQAVVSTTSLTPERRERYMARLHAYMAELIARLRREPADGLLMAMIRARDEEPGRLTEDELVLVAVRLLAPGAQNTVVTLANFVRMLIGRPERFAELRDRPGLIPGAVEELLRYTPFHTSTMFPRYATEKTTIGATVVQEGEAVVGSLCAANRDETVFGSSEELDFQRADNPHLAFGQGAHYCPGAHLARMQLQVGIGALARRVGGLRLAVPENELRWKRGMVVRWLEELPVTWSRIT
ncbi:cytochrome P450 [Actinomadura roseirufa]|uniref:cytochrome P450 n=1 Tax=Actinomadura roseirufa TaxID=2094049 RepID=UPI0010415081|nr:cytochrome P450 [Actinomadura roseirufa]